MGRRGKGGCDKSALKCGRMLLFTGGSTSAFCAIENFGFFNSIAFISVVRKFFSDSSFLDPHLTPSITAQSTQDLFPFLMLKYVLCNVVMGKRWEEWRRIYKEWMDEMGEEDGA